MAESKVEQGKLRLAIGMHCRPGYVVCGCGAWNTVDQRTECYMCHKPLYAAAASLPESQPTNSVMSRTCSRDMGKEVSQPAPEMDYEKEVDDLRCLINNEHLNVSYREMTQIIIKWLRAHDVRVQPSSVAGTERLREALKQIAETTYDVLPENLGTAMDKITELAESALKESSR